ncbi:MAG: YitT family protein [Peptostreptococcaceae bacterium]|nr:YitT family protein [Peptostreptococcaceae bacterium]
MKKSKRDIVLDIIFVLIGTGTIGFTISAVMIPNGLTSGGITGVARIVQEAFGISFAIIYYILLTSVFILVTVLLGFKEGKKLMLISVVLPTMILIFEKLDIKLLDEKDLMLAAVYCGVLFGIGLGLVFWRGYSTGGTDSIAQILKRKVFPFLDTSRILFIIDASVILISALVFGKNIALYALVTQYITMKLIDAVMYGFTTKLVQLDVITNIPEKLKDFVIENVARGVSSTEITGEYTGIKRRQLIIICSPRESMLVKRFLSTKDPNSMVTVTALNSVWGIGRGFKQIDKDDII